MGILDLITPSLGRFQNVCAHHGVQTIAGTDAETGAGTLV
jgi:hypothetical protein